ncbi:MAG: methionine--tRNA ligase subunit beta, partial [Pseudoflavonifractor sp.]
GNDGVMTYELMCERINSDLANVLGNLVNRTIAMTHKYFDGVVQAPCAKADPDGELEALALALPAAVQAKMDTLHIGDAIDQIFTLLRRANKYIDETAPWVLAKDAAAKPRLGTVLYHLLEAIRFAAVALEPFLPETSRKIFVQLALENKGWDSLQSFDGISAGHKVGTAEILFGRIDIPQKLEEIAAAAPQPAAPAVTFKENIAFPDFEKVDMTVVKVRACENVPKSEKLLKFQLDDGSGTPRQILSGIAKYYKAEELVGKTLVACTNLAPRKMMGLLSCGMLLSAEKDGELNLIMIDDKIPAGAKLC